MVFRNKIPWYWYKTLFQLGHLGGWIFIVAKLFKYIKTNTLVSLKILPWVPLCIFEKPAVSRELCYYLDKDRFLLNASPPFED